MSGIKGDRYELTATKALHWHRRRDCDCRTLLDVAQRHLRGFSWDVGDERGNWIAVRRPEDATDRQFEAAIYAAVSS